MKSSTNTYFRLLEFAKPYRFQLALAILCMLVTAGLETLTLYFIKPLTDQGFMGKDPEVARHMLSVLPLAIVGTMLLKGIFSYLGDILNNGVSNGLVVDARNRLFDKFTRMELAFHSHQRIGQITSRLTYDAQTMQSGVSDVVGRVIGSGLRILFLVALILYTAWFLTLKIAIILPLVIGPLYYFGSRIRKYAARDQEKMADMTSLAQEVFSGIRVVLAFGQEETERERFRKVVKAHYDAVMKKLRIAAMSSPVMETIGGTAFAIMIYLAGNMAIDKQMTVGDFFTLAGAAAAIYPQFKSLNGVNVSIQSAIAAGERVFSILDAPIAVHDEAGAKEIGPLRQALSFEKVSFSYGDTKVLRGIDFKVKAGQRVALVGPSGAGKTTMVDLVPRFHDVKSGHIRWDGLDLRQATVRSLRSQIGVVTQETFLFNDTIATNIAYGRPEASLKEIQAAAKAANAHDFILKQPEAYSTVIGERGVRLSGGQRQRLSIARAILKNPPVLILDEATASLDTESERAVQIALDHLMQQRTTLVIAHRLSTVRHADLILVVDKGKIVERGRHSALLKRGGLYAKLYKMQFADKKTEDAPVDEA